MTKRRKRVPKSGAVWHQTPEEATMARKPYINGYACGHGVHGDVKYNRAKERRAWRKQTRREGASYGPFSFFVVHAELCCLSKISRIHVSIFHSISY